ncbi:hypothetical protein SPHINGOT1_80162 [Sphingomonas sp. T1]|jgi:hypothetical protein|uniref:carph-isopro domain-containing protein n=1 Tax=Sphingomonas sp. T1 TaxID=2653172 RepID=UPI0012F11835|nr:hypothetical protein SPHINGOT1_80162 [Sphingomonas sp. T1]
MTTRSVIASFGGITKMARALRHRNPSTVQGWWERQIIPARRLSSVLAAAERLNINVGPADLISDLGAAHDASSQVN